LIPDVRGGETGLRIVRWFTAPEAGNYALWTSTGGAMEIRMVAAAEDPAEEGPHFRVLPGQIVARPIPPGTYELEVARDVHPAKLHLEPLYDPKLLRVKA